VGIQPNHTQNEVESNHTECDESTCGGFKHMQSTTLPTTFNFLFFLILRFSSKYRGNQIAVKNQRFKKVKKMDKMPSSNSRDIMSESTKCAEQKKTSSHHQQEKGSTVNITAQVHYCLFYDPSQCTKAINSITRNI